MCALLIWIPHEKAQVTESLLKQFLKGKKKKIYVDLFYFFQIVFFVGGQEQTGFSACSLQKGFFCDASE